MNNEKVAVLDIRSLNVTFLIGCKGVNGTFIECGNKSEKYGGYTTEGFLDEASFTSAVKKVVDSVRSTYLGKIDEVSVSVPAPFLTLRTKGQSVSFPRRRKITGLEVEELFDKGLVDVLENGRCIRRSAMYFWLSDDRKYFDASALYGTYTSVLNGALCYYFVSEEFYSFLTELLRGLGFEKINFVPSGLAQAEYLLPKKIREGYAVLMDVGLMSSTTSIVYGNGVVKEYAVDCGEVWMIDDLMQYFKCSGEKAEEIFRNANISRGTPETEWEGSEGKRYSVREIKDIITRRLDMLTEPVHSFLQVYDDDKTSGGVLNIPLYITGEGVMHLSGLLEYVSSWLNHYAEIVSPEIPYYDKPTYSSLISLLNTAVEDKEESGFFKKLLNLLGGKKK